MTDDVTTRARSALESVTEGGWQCIPGGSPNAAVVTSAAGPVCLVTVRMSTDVPAEVDARFIAESRSLVPELLGEVEKWQLRCGQAVCNLQLREAERDEARAEVERLRSALDELRAECRLNATDDLLAKDVRSAYERCAKSLRALRGNW